MIFTTASGSSYQIDKDNKRIKRIVGKENPTARQGTDGEWKQYSTISELTIGMEVIIFWDKSVPLLPGSDKNSSPATITSPVVSIGEIQ